jgi:hypothetical protein
MPTLFTRISNLPRIFVHSSTTLTDDFDLLKSASIKIAFLP